MARGPKAGFGKPPAKGTKARAFLLACLRPQGCSSDEAMELMGCPSPAALIALRDQKGYDVRAFYNGTHGATASGVRRKRKVSYRLVGKMKWDCGYRSFLGSAGA